MHNEKDIIEFEDIFKEEREKRQNQSFEPKKRNTYVYVIMFYLFTMFFIASILYFTFFSMAALKDSFNEKEALLNALSYDQNGIVLLEEPTSFLSDYVIMVGTFEDYFVYIHGDRENIEILYDEALYNPLVFYEIFDGTVTEWSDSEPIHIYKGRTQSYTFDVEITIPSAYIISAYDSLSSFGLNVLNFSIYIVLLPVLIIFLKSDLVKEFKLFKHLKSQWFMMIVGGYLYIILGNILSNVLSQFLATVLSIEPSEAVNQAVIIRSLNSQGMPLMILSAVIMGPIVEELVFRKAFFGLFSSDKMALVVSSLAFGAIHLTGESSLGEALVNGVSYIVMGFVFGYIYLKYEKNIWVPIFVHILSNLIAILAILFVL